MAGHRVNWWFVIGGIVLVVFGVAIFAAPGLFLELLTVWAGVGFLVSGAASIASFIQMRHVLPGASWSLLMAALDLVVGVLLIAHPYTYATILPWLLGAAFIAFGIAQVAGMIPFAKLYPETRTIVLVSGVLSVVVGVMFIIWPASLSIWVAAFVLVRGVTLISMGFTVRV